MRGSVLYFFLLILEVFFNFTPDAIHKCGRFSKFLLEKGLEFIPCEGVGSILLCPSLMLLPPEIDPLLAERDHKRYAFVALSLSRLKIVFTLPAKEVAFYMQAPIV